MKLRLIPMPPDEQPAFAPVLFSMVTRQSDKTGSGGSVHWKKATHYTLDFEFQEHLNNCNTCREQMIASLQETIKLISQGGWR